MALFIVEGKREIEAFNAAGKNFEEIYFSQSLSNEISSSSILSTLLERVPSFELSEDAINKVSYRQHGSEFIGVAKTWDLKLRSPIDMDWELVLVLDEVEKPGNLGAILRTAEALWGGCCITLIHVLIFLTLMWLGHRWDSLQRCLYLWQKREKCMNFLNKQILR